MREGAAVIEEAATGESEVHTSVKGCTQGITPYLIGSQAVSAFGEFRPSPRADLTGPR